MKGTSTIVLAILPLVIGFTPMPNSVRRVDLGLGRPATIIASPGEGEVIAAAQSFVDEATGFYSPLKPDCLASDFVFRGGVIGPLNKHDYLATMESLGIFDAFDLKANAFGFTVDPADPLSVRFFVRNTGSHVGPFLQRGPLSFRPDPARSSVVGPTEAAMLTFEPGTLKVRFFTTGNVVKFGNSVQGRAPNTGGLGAVLGLFYAIGFGGLGNLALNGYFRSLFNWAGSQLGSFGIPLTKSEVVPAWWTEG
mmetsp:Transcript_37882/g.69248  ORF Transcript_37882/g.69248 Transcript_37882/m.69248 type:complete len:251 (-) Transcript_37882:67-819(-)